MAGDYLMMTEGAMLLQ